MASRSTVTCFFFIKKGFLLLSYLRHNSALWISSYNLFILCVLVLILLLLLMPFAWQHKKAEKAEKKNEWDDNKNNEKLLNFQSGFLRVKAHFYAMPMGFQDESLLFSTIIICVYLNNHKEEWKQKSRIKSQILSYTKSTLMRLWCI